MYFTTIQLFCSRLGFISWLQNHLLACPFKYLTGVDCPGCGFQRAVIALLRGDFGQSFHLYPPAIPLLIVFAYFALDGRFKLDNPAETIKKSLFIVAASIVLVSYTVKMSGIIKHYNSSAAAIAVK